jgi:hypothetical protein
MKSTPIFCLILALCSFLPKLAHAADERELTTNSAIYLLHSAMKEQYKGREIPLLKSLRQLKDPQLAPLFEELARYPHPVMKIHGILGLAECSPEKNLDLLRITSIEQPTVQIQVIAAAIDSNLLSDDQANQLINWPNLDVAARLIVAAHQISRGTFDKPHILEDATKTDKLDQASFARILQAWRNTPGALEELNKLQSSDDPDKNSVRSILLLSSIRYNIEVMGQWAIDVARDETAPGSLRLLGLKAAMRLKVPEAQTVWQSFYNATDDLAQKTRLALRVVREATVLAPSLFDTLIAEDYELLQKLGKAGKAIAAKQNISENVINLIGMKTPHTMATAWALLYAQTEASPEDAQAILLSLLYGYENADRRSKPYILQDAIAAAQTIMEQFPDKASAMLLPILNNTQTDSLLIHGMLLAMIRSDAPVTLDLANAMTNTDDTRSKQMLLLIKAKRGVELTRNQLHDLSLMVRGGGINDESIRIQAGWAYLKQTGQVKQALDRVVYQQN